MAAPPMPDILPFPTQVETSRSDGDAPAPSFLPGLTPSRVKSVRAGAWMLNYAPVNSPLVAYDGTMRVETIPGGRRASGDLYQRPLKVPFPFPEFPRPGNTIQLLPPPDPANGIPVQAISRYRYYLRVTKILENVTIANSFELGFQMFLFTPTSNGAGTWSPPATSAINCTATMTWTPAPAGYPSSSDYLEGS
ncbi:hypothetical protein TrVFT333_004733 [Trichoderma virens FT-333]|nr:hypothetical protein TrVFT333_004733 [Trichoderma virens FT-333]